MEVYLEQYVLSIQVEAKQTLEMAKTLILPAAYRYQAELAVDLIESLFGKSTLMRAGNGA